MNASKLAALCITLVFAAGSSSAQKAASWMAISSAGGELTFVMPKDCLIISESNTGMRIVYSAPHMRLDVARTLNSGSGYRMAAPSNRHPDANTRNFQLGKTRGQVTISEKPGRYSLSIFARAPDYTYTIEAHGKRADDPAIRRFLAALSFEGKPLLTVAGDPKEVPANVVDMKGLKSSPVVKDYLKKRPGRDLMVVFDPIDPKTSIAKVDDDDGDNAPQGKYEGPFVTRPLIVLEKPRAVYTDQARQAGVRGSIRAVVLFRADGTIGSITVDPRLDPSLARNVAEAAKQIKFIPAAVEGKEVDVKRMLVYTFNIY